VRWVVRARGIPHLTPTLSAPKGGEGDFQFAADRLQNTLNIFHHLSIPKSDHPIAVTRELGASTLITLSKSHVLSAIELDHQLHRRTRKVSDMFADRMLTAKSIWKPELAQLQP
jgi:hypothetical protein